MELPSELERLETHQALLLTNRVIFLDTVTNNTELEPGDYHQVAHPTPILSIYNLSEVVSFCDTSSFIIFEGIMPLKVA